MNQHLDFDEDPTFFPDSFCGGRLRTRPVSGGLYQPGRGAAWVNFDFELIEGITLSPFVRAAMLADFANGVGSIFAGQPWSFADFDINIAFYRLPDEDWLLIDAETHSAGNCHATVYSKFPDSHGLYARAFQSLFIAAAEINVLS